MSPLPLEPVYEEHRVRLAAGLELIDHVRDAPVTGALDVTVEDAGRPVPGFRRHDGGRFALVYSRMVRTPLRVLIHDPAGRYVPRRMLLPVLEERRLREPLVGYVPARDRTWRPHLFPGAAYDHGPRATGVRGRAVGADGRAVPWVRVVATLAGTDDVVGRAHGDGRGEFLLLVEDPRDTAELPASVDVTVTVTAPRVVPDPPARTRRSDEPLWALPEERPSGPPRPDRVLDGREPPPGHIPGRRAVHTLSLDLGAVSGDRVPYDLR